MRRTSYVSAAMPRCCQCQASMMHWCPFPTPCYRTPKTEDERREPVPCKANPRHLLVVALLEGAGPGSAEQAGHTRPRLPIRHWEADHPEEGCPVVQRQNALCHGPHLLLQGQGWPPVQHVVGLHHLHSANLFSQESAAVSSAGSKATAHAACRRSPSPSFGKPSQLRLGGKVDAGPCQTLSCQ